MLKGTDGFSDTNLLGKGRYDSVSRGTVQNHGVLVAVKVFNLQQPGSCRSFQAGCEALRRVRHRCLVKVITSLEQRLYITIDIAEAIDYLHNGCQTSIIHCDLKPNNILLTQYMRACVAQQHSSYSGHEGLCCRSQDSKWSCKNNFLNSNTIGIRGSIGYFAPGNFNMLLSALHY